MAAEEEEDGVGDTQMSAAGTSVLSLAAMSGRLATVQRLLNASVCVLFFLPTLSVSL